MESTKVQICLLLVASGFQASRAASAIGLSAIDKDYRNQCVDESTGARYRLHSSWPMKNQCGQHTCVKYANQMYIQYETCGNVDTVAPCKIVENLSASYPECCPRVVCEEPKVVQQLPVVHFTGETDLDNEINTDYYDESDKLFMMSSNDMPSISYDVFLSGDEISEQQHPNENHEPVEYMVDWDQLFAAYN